MRRFTPASADPGPVPPEPPKKSFNLSNFPAFMGFMMPRLKNLDFKPQLTDEHFTLHMKMPRAMYDDGVRRGAIPKDWEDAKD
ncbi:MAG TPA: hypothetical protein VJ873_12065 [bacterium]|nr:hypothetical protein [bacterium]